MFDSRTISKPVYEALFDLRSQQEAKERNQDKLKNDLKDQKNQAIELYTYLATWGLMRLKAEEKDLSQEGKKQVVRKFFTCLESLSGKSALANDQGVKTLIALSPDDYLGLTGLGLELAQEFAFWANAVYHNIKGED